MSDCVRDVASFIHWLRNRYLVSRRLSNGRVILAVFVRDVTQQHLTSFKHTARKRRSKQAIYYLKFLGVSKTSGGGGGGTLILQVFENFFLLSVSRVLERPPLENTLKKCLPGSRSNTSADVRVNTKAALLRCLKTRKSLRARLAPSSTTPDEVTLLKPSWESV